MNRPAHKWFLAGLLFLATLLNYLDRQTVSVSASQTAAHNLRTLEAIFAACRAAETNTAIAILIPP